MKQIDFKKYLHEVVIFVVFLVASVLYFYPALQDKVIYASDGVQSAAAARQSVDYHQKTGDYTYWTDAMFSGMPNYQVGGGEIPFLDKILKPFVAFCRLSLRNEIYIFLFYLIAFFLLLRAFGVNKWFCMAGAFAIALSSYFFIIIGAQHHGKCYSITWMTLVVIGFILTYKRHYGWGSLMTMAFTYVGFFLHPQMSYYISMMIGILFFAELALAYKEKAWKHFGIATAIFLGSFAVGMGMGSANIFINQEYARETMRGGHSDLKKVTDEGNKTEGLDLDYATAWSEGIDETLTLLVPNYMGGASGYDLGKESELENDLRKMGVPRRQAEQFASHAPTYWGDKSFTSGPVYIGAIVCMLFLLGAIIVPGPYKWALLAATLFSILLSWGRHFMPLTEFFYHYFPMYNKFRAVESILIVAEITMPLLAFLALKTIAQKELAWEKLQKMLLVAAGIVAFICLWIVVRSGSVEAVSEYDKMWKGQVGQQIYEAIVSQRRAMMRADAWRSLLFVLIGTAATWAYAYNVYKKANYQKVHLLFGSIFTLLIIIDLWPVDKRFCNNDMYVSKKQETDNFRMYSYEKMLLENDPTFFRVLNLTVNTFNDARTSYYLNSVGGYSAAKLRRYQDLIEEHISKMNFNVLNMLNTKYIITAGAQGEPTPQLNSGAMGACWLVDSLLFVSDANSESDALNNLDLHQYAVLDKTFPPNAAILNATAWSAEKNANDSLIMLSHTPKNITYYSNVQTPRVAVFSEIYYPHGWKVKIDDKPYEIEGNSPLLRVNYMLRALILPTGEHTITLHFDPDAPKKGNRLSLACFAVFLIVLSVTLYDYYRKKRKELIVN